MQLLTPILLGVGFVSLYQATPGPGGIYLQNAGLMWMLPLPISVIGAYLFMNNLTSARSTFKDQLAIVRRKFQDARVVSARRLIVVLAEALSANALVFSDDVLTRQRVVSVERECPLETGERLR